MVDSLITITSLTLVPTVGGFVANVLWTAPDGLGCLPYMQPAKFEFYASAASSFGSATKVGESAIGLFTYGGLGASTTRYVWVRAVDPAGNAGAVYPSGAGQSVTTLTTLPPANSVGNTELKSGAVTPDKMTVSSLSAITANLGTMTAGTLTAAVSYLGRVHASQIDTPSLSAISANLGSIIVQNANIGNLAVDNLKIAGFAVSTDKVINNAISDVALSGPGFGQGDLASTSITVTNGYALIMASFILDIPASNSANVGYINIGIKRDGSVIAQRTIFYDDNFAGGYPMSHADGASVGGHTYTVYANNNSGAGMWNMSGSILVINFRK